MDRINEARRTLGLSVRYYEAWAAEETALARTAITLGEFDKVLADLWPVDADASKRSTTIAESAPRHFTAGSSPKPTGLAGPRTRPSAPSPAT
jgi:hypothetical protein